MFTRGDLRKTRYYREVREEVRQEEALGLIMRLLPRRISTVNPQWVLSSYPTECQYPYGGDCVFW